MNKGLTETKRAAIIPGFKATPQETGEVNAVRDGKRMRAMARELCLKCRQAIIYEAQEMDVPTIKYKYQYLLEEVIADMESFV